MAGTTFDESRTNHVRRNALWSIGTTILLAIASFAVRTIFIRTLSAEYLGVNGLFTNVLAILSFSELGIGTAINYALYRPIAEGDEGQIKSLMRLFKNAYRVIALVVLGLGLVVVPLLPYLVNSDLSLDEVRLYYLIYLANTVTSYFVVYRTSFVTAAQRGYLVTNSNAAGQIVTYIIQIPVLVFAQSFLEYLLVSFVVGLVKNIVVSIYIGRKFPVVHCGDAAAVDSETLKGIKRNVSALVLHKVGDVGVHQSDNIIVSMLVSTAAVGLLSNYTMVTALTTKLTESVFGTVTASLGNLFAKEGFERRRTVFEEYDLLGFLLNCGVLVVSAGVIQPFIRLWAGDALLVDDVTVLLLLYSVFLQGMCTVVYQFKVADGHYVEDRWIAFGQTAINIAVSVVAVMSIGLPGVYVGTIAQRMLPMIVWPHITCKKVLGLPTGWYYARLLFRSGLALLMALCAWYVTGRICMLINLETFALSVVVSFLIASIPLAAIYARTESFHRLVHRFVRK